MIAHHQWLTLGACVLMWGPSLAERLLSKWGVVTDVPLVVSVFLFLLGHTHNLLRSVLHAVFAQQIHSLVWRENNGESNARGRRTNERHIGHAGERWVRPEHDNAVGSYSLLCMCIVHLQYTLQNNTEYFIIPIENTS